MQSEKYDKKCSTCVRWSRGGYGVGRGNGHCMEFHIPKSPANRVTNIGADCWAPSYLYLKILKNGGKEENDTANVTP